MSDPYDIIGHYAKLLFQAEVYRASGKRVPAAMQTEIHALDAHAQAILSPQQLAVAQDHVNIAKASMHRQLQTHMQQANARTIAEGTDNLSKEVTSGMLGHGEGLTADQYRELNRTGKVTFKPKRATQAERDAAFREGTKHVDPRGKGFNEAEWTARLDDLTDGDDAKRAKYAAEHNLNPTDVNAMTKNWSRTRVQVGLERRYVAKDPPKETTVVADDDSKRRLAVTNAYLKHTHQENKPDEPVVSKDWRESGGVRGALAKAAVDLQNKPAEPTSAEQPAAA
jgi:hypothetical protein